MSSNVKAVLGVIGVVLVVGYLNGFFDKPLSQVGLNVNDCIEVLGTTRCGDEVNDLRERLASVGDDAEERLREKPDPPPEKAPVGAPLTLATGPADLQVTTDAIVDPQPAGEFVTPEGKGSRFVGVELTVRNQGQEPFAESVPTVQLLTTEGRQADPSLFYEGDCGSTGSSFLDNLRLLPGDVRRGCVAFEVREGDDVSEFRFTVPAQDDLGTDPEPTGIWKVTP